MCNLSQGIKEDGIVIGEARIFSICQKNGFTAWLSAREKRNCWMREMVPTVSGELKRGVALNKKYLVKGGLIWLDTWTIFAIIVIKRILSLKK